MSSNTLQDLRVLLVEDDPIIALDIVDTLSSAGAQVVGPAHTVNDAMAAIEGGGFDVAVLDFRLEKETASAVATRLEADGCAYLFHTSSRDHPERLHPRAPIIDKPSRPELLISAVRALKK